MKANKWIYKSAKELSYVGVNKRCHEMNSMKNSEGWFEAIFFFYLDYILCMNEVKRHISFTRSSYSSRKKFLFNCTWPQLKLRRFEGNEQSAFTIYVIQENQKVPVFSYAIILIIYDTDQWWK